MSEQLIHTPGVFGENGNYLLERELGSGGMGGVYMGRDKMLDRPVAVKVMLKELGDDPEFVEKFKKEAQSAARLIHPNIAQIYSYGISNGMPYISMELAAGGSLFSIMTANPGKTDVARVIKICQQVAQALQCASDQGCVHGDVKPENILLDANGNAKLVDFGLASMQKETEEIWGTPYYIAPEKVKKEAIDFRADMFSLGGTLYHALTGVAPFEGADSVAVVKKRFEGAPKKPSEIRSDLTPAIDGLVMKMLAVAKEDRYPSFEALIEAFKEVLTTGLTATAASAQKPAAASSAAKKPAAGARRLAVGRRGMALRRPGAKPSLHKGEDEGEGKIAKKGIELPPVEDDEEEEGGGLGAKVLLVIFGAILLVGGVIGGLVWYTTADKKARAAEEFSQISGGIGKARAAIAETIEAAKKFADEFDEFSEKAIVECQKPTDELKKLLPEEQAAQLKPGPTQELLDAIASTNIVEVSTNATDAASATNSTAAASAAAAAGTQRTVVAAQALPKFREPTEDEKDPASPEGEAYQKARKEFYEALVKKLAGGGKDANAADGTNEVAAAEGAAPAEGASAEPPKEEKKPEPASQAVIAMIELWERAYGCKASAIRIRLEVRKVCEKGAEADEIKEMTQQAMDKLADLSREVVEMFDKVKTSKDVENVKKGIGFIRQKGAKTVEQTLRDIKKAKLEAERKAKAEEEARLEKERKEKQAAERKARVESETAAAKAKFDAIVTQGCFRQLDWKSALRMLNSLKSESTTPEGQLACDLEIRKVNDMKMVQDIFIENLKGHEMKGKKLRNCTVEDVNENEIVLAKKGVKEKVKIPWQKFYKEYPGNLNEILNTYVVNTRQPNSKVRIASPLKWANAMTGAALTMRLVCPEVIGAMERSEELVRRTVMDFPDYEKTAKEIFPDISLEDAKKEE